MTRLSHAVRSAPVAAAFPAEPLYATWQQALKDAVRDPLLLASLLDLPDRWGTDALRAAETFPLFAPKSYIARMQKGNPRDPLLRQVLPVSAELTPTPGFSPDPVGDAEASLLPGLLHKYDGRVLMVTTGACAVHCRYCFRREFPYSEIPPGADAWDPALARIRSDKSIREVILSGGDPLTLVDSQLRILAERLADIPHLRRIRIHTRLPVVLPQRVTDELLGWLRGSRLTPIVVIHANHAAELVGSAASAIARLVDAGIPLLNQSVLLRGVNDTVPDLVQLSERLLDLRVIPYYLHLLDRVRGAAHFEVPTATGIRLIESLRRQLPGYAVPRLVREISGQPHKIPLA